MYRQVQVTARGGAGGEIEEGESQEEHALKEWLDSCDCLVFWSFLKRKRLTLSKLQTIDYDLLKRGIHKLDDTRYDEFDKATCLGAVKTLQLHKSQSDHVLVTPEEAHAAMSLYDRFTELTQVIQYIRTVYIYCTKLT